MKSNNIYQKINLMIGTDPSGQGGIASVSRNMLTLPFATEWNIQLVTSHKSVNKFAMFFIFAWSFVTIFLSRLKGEPGLAHIHLASRGSFSRKEMLARWARFLGFRILIHLHGGQFDKFYEDECSTAKKNKVEKLFYSAHQVVVLSRNWFLWVKKTFPGVKKLDIVYNFGPSDTFPRKVSNNSTILFLGRICEAKGIHDLIKVLPNVIACVPELKVILGGDGDITPFLEQAEKLGVLQHVDFIGWVEKKDKLDLLASCSVFVLPSYYEGFPVGITEAMAFGIPVVATDVGGIPDAISDEQEGLLIKPGDLLNLGNSLIKLLLDKQFADELARNAQQKYKQSFCSEAILPLWNDIYKGILLDIPTK
jgi:glycosyltransferase involved in cell wall biosynthesis